MKTKIILLIAVSAIATLSFSFSSTNSGDKVINETPNVVENEPIGGFVSEDKF